MELADLARLRSRGQRPVQLRVFRAVCDHSRFSMGESRSLRRGRCFVDRRPVPRVWPAATLSRQDFRVDIRDHQFVAVRFLCLRDFLCAATSAALRAGATSWTEGSIVFVARPNRQRGRIGGFTFTERRGPDFLSRPLVTALQLRVAEFPAASFGFHVTRRSCGGD